MPLVRARSRNQVEMATPLLAAPAVDGAVDQPSIKKPKAARSLIPAPSAKPIDVSSEEALGGLSSEDDAAAGSLGKRDSREDIVAVRSGQTPYDDAGRIPG